MILSNGMGIFGGLGEVFTDRAAYEAAREDYEAALSQREAAAAEYEQMVAPILEANQQAQAAYQTELRRFRAEEETRGMAMDAWWDAKQAAKAANEQQAAAYAQAAEQYQFCRDQRDRKKRLCDVRKRQEQDAYQVAMANWMQADAKRRTGIQTRMADRNAYSTGSDPFPSPYSASGIAIAERLIPLQVSKGTREYARTICERQYPALRGLGALPSQRAEYDRLVAQGLTACEISVIATAPAVMQPPSPRGGSCALPHCGPRPQAPQPAVLPPKPDFGSELTAPAPLTSDSLLAIPPPPDFPPLSEEPEWGGTDFGYQLEPGSDQGDDSDLDEPPADLDEPPADLDELPADLDELPADLDERRGEGGMSTGLILLLVAAVAGGGVYLYSRSKSAKKGRGK